MLKKLSANGTDVLNDTSMEKITGNGLYCVFYIIEIAADCANHGGVELGMELFEEQSANTPGL